MMTKAVTLQNNNTSAMGVLTSVQYDLQKIYLNENVSLLPIEYVKDEVTLSGVTKEEIMSKVRFFRLAKFVYEKDIKISYKLRSVFSALHSVDTSLMMKLVSDGKHCELWVGVKNKQNVVKKAKVLQGAIEGNFPGTAFTNAKVLTNGDVLQKNQKIFNSCKEVTAVVGIPSLKDEDEEHFIQGIENLILGMNGKAFSALFIAEPVQSSQVEFAINAYEQIYSVLSSEQEFVTTDGTNQSTSTSESVSESSSYSTSNNVTEGTNESTTTNSSPWLGRRMLNSLFGTGSKTANSLAETAEFIANNNHIVRGLKFIANNNPIVDTIRVGKPDFRIDLDLKTKTEGSKTKGTNYSKTEGTSETNSTSKSTSHSNSQGTSTSLQKTFTNKKIGNFLERLDKQIKRLEQGKGIGFWNVGAYFISDEEQHSVIAANIYNGVIKGSESNFETNIVKTFNVENQSEREKIIQYLERYEIPRIENYGYLGQAVTTDELSIQINFPHKSIIGLDVVEITPFGNNPQTNVNNSIKIGNLYNYDKEFTNTVQLDYNKFTGHIFVTGSTGSGKSNVTYNLIEKLCDKNIHFLVIEPAKGEYKDEFGGRKDVSVYGTNPDYTKLLKINPFQFPKGIHIYEHIDRFIEILNACWPMEAAMPNLLKEAVEDAYLNKGWLLEESRCIYEKAEYPLFLDLLQSLENVINRSKFSAEVKSNYEGALVSRVRSMTNGINRLIFTNDAIPDEDLFDKNVIIDLSRVASSEGKALFMGLIFMKLNQYRIASKQGNNRGLKHITILEEAHNLLKRTSTEQSNDGANLAGKSVEMISNAIAEMRTYGEGFIIADQAPGLLDMSVIRNTNTKICLRLPDFEDRKLVGNAMNLTDEQIKELASLETGVAAVYQNDWQEAILCKFEKFISQEREFVHHKDNSKRMGEIKECIMLIENIEKLGDEDLKKIKSSLHFTFLAKHFYTLLNSNTSNNLIKNNFLKIIQKTLSVEINEAKKVAKCLLLQLMGLEEEITIKNKINSIIIKIQ